MLVPWSFRRCGDGGGAFPGASIALASDGAGIGQLIDHDLQTLVLNQLHDANAFRFLRGYERSRNTSR